MKDYTKKIDSGNGRMKTGPTRKRDYKINPKAIQRLQKNLMKSGWTHLQRLSIVDAFKRRAKRGIL